MDMDLFVLNISRHKSLYHYIISENIQLSLILWVMAILVQEDHVVIPVITEGHCVLNSNSNSKTIAVKISNCKQFMTS
jgi:hypothetical protein